MKYDFNKPVDRSRNASVKYDNLVKLYGREDLISMWIADMDLPVAQPILDALEDRVQQSVFGYTIIPESYNQAVSAWQKKRNNWDANPALMSYAVGVVPAINAVVDCFSSVGDEILFCTPVYPQFFNAVENRKRKIVTSALKEEQGQYSIDFEDLEEKMQRKPAIFILCSPHNPGGRVWSRQELLKIAELCIKYDVLILSDEIHSDLILWGNEHIPVASLSKEISDNTITCISATKTFNLAGVQACTVVSPNMETKKKLDDFWKHLNIDAINCFAQVAMETAFREGENWLEQLIEHLEGNIEYAESKLEDIPKIKMQRPQSTYLLWLDCRELGMSDRELMNFMVEKAGLALNAGTDYGKEGSGFVRMNIATPRPVVQRAMEQLEKAVKSL